MGNREDLMAGAKRCLYEKGYGRTTARDIANASGVSLAAIGYHFGTKDALLNAAMIEAIGEMGEALATVVAEAGQVSESPEVRFAAIWNGLRDVFVEHRGLWAAQFEALAQAGQAPELAEAFAAAQKEGRLGLAALFQGLPEVADTDEELVRGAFYQTLLAGYAAQWLAAPDLVPTGADFVLGLRLVSESVLGTGQTD
ncbi:TetR/AcrR family transcriptional regulator [Kitasatospora sp. NPDC097643]|uniref:TetR/AcrR family transcriptional regulator n=1 Tax=Kitasatospora sp. NPDC097643 TaxID=3157230 RepID=UPI00332CEBFF